MTFSLQFNVQERWPLEFINYVKNKIMNNEFYIMNIADNDIPD